MTNAFKRPQLFAGEAHLPGLQCLWNSGAWNSRIQSADWKSCVFQRPPKEIMEASNQKGSGLCTLMLIMAFSPHNMNSMFNLCAGVRRALAEAVVGLRGSKLVVNAMIKELGPIPHDQLESYMITSETYGCCRMLLAALEQDLFNEVVAGRGCDFWAELQPLRDLRPVNGGPGHNLGLLIELRELNFDLS